MSKLGDWARDFVHEKVFRKQRLLEQNILAELRRRTPVDTGAARRGWEIEGKDAKYGIEVAKGSIKRFSATRITNRESYIVELNRGSSRQAPAGFVQAAIVHAVEQSRK